MAEEKRAPVCPRCKAWHLEHLTLRKGSRTWWCRICGSAFNIKLQPIAFFCYVIGRNVPLEYCRTCDKNIDCPVHRHHDNMLVFKVKGRTGVVSA